MLGMRIGILIANNKSFESLFKDQMAREEEFCSLDIL